MTDTRVVRVCDGVSWVGALDPDLRVFDVIMSTDQGTTYNSYLVQGSEKTALIDVVKGPFTESYLDTLRESVDPTSIDYIIIQHTEPDHSGSLAAALSLMPQATVVCSKFAQSLLREIVNADFPCQVVRDGDSIDLGSKSLRFVHAPFLHWPDSIFTYLPENRVLFSGDVFGCHYCEPLMFDDLIEENLEPVQKYYFDVIMSPFKEHMLKAIAKVEPLGIDIVCPSHGPILRSTGRQVVEMLKRWSEDVNQVNAPPRLFVGYVSAYGNTRQLAEQIAKGAQDAGMVTTIGDVSDQDLAVTIAEIEASDAVLLGSPTFNRDIVKPVWDVLVAMSAFKMKGRIGGAFGSYGWSGEAVTLIEDRLKHLGLKLTQPGCRTKLVPSAEVLKTAYEYGQQVAASVAG